MSHCPLEVNKHEIMYSNNVAFFMFLNCDRDRLELDSGSSYAKTWV